MLTGFEALTRLPWALPTISTEAWLSPPPGDYSFRVEMVGNAQGNLVSASKPVSIKVRAGTE